LASYEAFMVQFDCGSARITPRSAAILENAATMFRRYPPCLTLALAAHTDRREAATLDPILAARRARAVIRHYRRIGVRLRFKVETYGATRPLIENAQGEEAMANRRVEMWLVPPDERGEWTTPSPPAWACQR
jgi:outer membrane protein OmpA-like peptidoglycan-associated protein